MQPTIYVDHHLETVTSQIYGQMGHSCKTGHKELSDWKKDLVKLFRTIGQAVKKNVNGDDNHRDLVVRRCDTAINSIKSCQSIDAASMKAIGFSIEIIFQLLGHFPQNFLKMRAYHGDVTDLSKYRIFTYVRTQKHLRAEKLQKALQPRGGGPTGG
jgi:hypothetical protein